MGEDEVSEDTGGGDKRAPRIKLSEIAALELSDGRKIGVVVSDVSAAGFRVVVSESVKIGMQVKLLMRRYDPVPAKIRWVEGNEAGAVFLNSAEGTVG